MTKTKKSMPKGVAFVKTMLDMAIPVMSVAILFVHSLIKTAANASSLMNMAIYVIFF